MFQFGSDDAICTCAYPFVSEIKDDMENAYPVYPSQDMNYKIIFDNYISYQVRNESFCSMDDYEIKKGKYFILFERSRYLNRY